MQYSQRAAVCDQIINLKLSNHFYFKNVIVSKASWDYSKFKGPPSNSFLKKYPSDYNFTFDEAGCNDLSAFCVEGIVNNHCQIPLLHGNMSCKSSFSDNIVQFCQENCFKANFPLDVYFDKGSNSCKLVNLAKKIFCLQPSQDKSIPPLLWNQNLNECTMSPEYCSYFGLSYDLKNNECYLPSVQKFFEEYMFGKTLVRALIHPSLIFNHEVTKNIISPYLCSQVSAALKTRDESNILLNNLSKDILVGLTPDIVLYISNLSLQYLYKFTNNMADHLSKSILLSEINTIVADTLIINTLKVLHVCGKVASSWELFIIYFLGSALDIVDTLNLNKALTSLDFQSVMKHFDDSFKDKIKTQIVTPEMVLSLEVMQLKLKKQISKAYDLQYGGMYKLINIMNLYLQEPNEAHNNREIVSNNGIFSKVKVEHHKPDIMSFFVTALIILMPFGIISPALVLIILIIGLLFLLAKQNNITIE